MSCWPNQIKGIIFDNDGTLLDTLGYYVEATEIVLGQKLSEHFYKSVNGMAAYEVAVRSIENFKLDMTPEQFLEKRNKIVSNLLENSKPFPGVTELVGYFKKKGYKIGLATSCNKELTDIKFMNQPELEKEFDVIMTCDDVKEAKPDPEIFLKCAEKIGVKPENVLVFEDAINGVLAANSAGMAVAFFANGNIKYEEDFKKYGGSPNYIFQKYTDFDRSVFQWV